MMNHYSRGRHTSTISRRAYILLRRSYNSCGSIGRNDKLIVAVGAPLSSSSSSSATSTATFDDRRHRQPTLTARRYKSSSAFPDFPIPESVRQSAKATLLNEAVRDDSRWWQNQDHNDHNDHHDGNGTEETLLQHQQQNSTSQQQQQQQYSSTGVGEGGVNTPIVNNLKDESIEDLYIRETIVEGEGGGGGGGAETSASSSIAQQPTLDETTAADPFQLARVELDDLSRSIREDLIGTDHPVLNKAASYFFESSDAATGGKKIRPMMVLLLSRALSDTFATTTTTTEAAMLAGVDDTQIQPQPLFSQPLQGQRTDLPQSQRRLAEISEMMHTASLFHDDVIDGSDTRRGMPSVHSVFGNKMAILAGDYLLARASICLARLRDVRVVETMSTIIENLVRGEVMQMRGTPQQPGDDNNENQIEDYRMTYYLRKNYYKTASLMANSCKSTALLGNYPMEIVQASYKYGKHVGMAFQLVDDVLDYEGSLSQLGKPPLADLNAGLATGPVLFAAEEYPDELNPLINRKFENDGDIDTAVNLVFNSQGIERTKKLACAHAEYAVQAIVDNLRPSPYRDSLIHLAYKVVARTK